LIVTFVTFTSCTTNFLETIPTDRRFEYQCSIPKNTYHQFCKNIYSQNGEDGILEQLIRELQIKNGSFCEFGASDGVDSSNTYNLIKNYNFSGISIELDHSRYQKCIENYKLFLVCRYFMVAFFIMIILRI
jgi:hypothetical protein